MLSPGLPQSGTSCQAAVHRRHISLLRRGLIRERRECAPGVPHFCKSRPDIGPEVRRAPQLGAVLALRRYTNMFWKLPCNCSVKGCCGDSSMLGSKSTNILCLIQSMTSSNSSTTSSRSLRKTTVALARRKCSNPFRTILFTEAASMPADRKDSAHTSITADVLGTGTRPRSTEGTTRSAGLPMELLLASGTTAPSWNAAHRRPGIGAGNQSPPRSRRRAG